MAAEATSLPTPAELERDFETLKAAVEDRLFTHLFATRHVWMGKPRGGLSLDDASAEGLAVLARLRATVAQVPVLQAQVTGLEAQLPEGMKHCTILYKQCPLGHGWLTATNWIEFGCPTCAQRKVESERDVLRTHVADLTRELEVAKAAAHAACTEVAAHQVQLAVAAEGAGRLQEEHAVLAAQVQAVQPILPLLRALAAHPNIDTNDVILSMGCEEVDAPWRLTYGMARSITAAFSTPPVFVELAARGGEVDAGESQALAQRKAQLQALLTVQATCATCPKPATCWGAYEESHAPWAPACDDCCGHGNEDGHCERITAGATQPGGEHYARAPQYAPQPSFEQVLPADQVEAAQARGVRRRQLHASSAAMRAARLATPSDKVLERVRVLEDATVNQQRTIMEQKDEIVRLEVKVVELEAKVTQAHAEWDAATDRTTEATGERDSALDSLRSASATLESLAESHVISEHAYQELACHLHDEPCGSDGERIKMRAEAERDAIQAQLEELERILTESGAPTYDDPKDGSSVLSLKGRVLWLHGRALKAEAEATRLRLGAEKAPAVVPMAGKQECTTPASPALFHQPLPMVRAITEDAIRHALEGVQPVVVGSAYSEGQADAIEAIANRLGIDMGAGPPNEPGYGEKRLQEDVPPAEPELCRCGAKEYRTEHGGVRLCVGCDSPPAECLCTHTDEQPEPCATCNAPVTMAGDVRMCSGCSFPAADCNCTRSRVAEEEEDVSATAPALPTTPAKDPLDDVRVLKMEPGRMRDGRPSFNMTLKGAKDTLKHMAEAMVTFFKEEGGTNYVEVKVHHDTDGDFLLCVQRDAGKTPHEFRMEAEAARDVALAQVEELKRARDEAEDRGRGWMVRAEDSEAQAEAALATGQARESELQADNEALRNEVVRIETRESEARLERDTAQAQVEAARVIAAKLLADENAYIIERDVARRFLSALSWPPAEEGKRRVAAVQRREMLERLAKCQPTPADDGQGTVVMSWQHGGERKSYAVTTEQMHWLLGVFTVPRPASAADGARPGAVECGEAPQPYPRSEEAVMSPQPRRCDIVEYTLSSEDARCINRRRTRPSEVKDAIDAGRWPRGAQAHIGSEVKEGDVFPLVIVRVFPDEYGPGIPGVNGQVLLDGSDNYWVTSVQQGAAPGTWARPSAG